MQDNDQPIDRADDPIAWHPAFVEAMQMELDDYKDALEFHPEFQLTSQPLRIDCVIIKKAKGVTINKNIATIFRDKNIVEYKSPDDYVSIEDFNKVYAYAYLYASFERVPITSLTMTFIESRYLRDLLTHFEQERNYQVEETSPGIYTVRGDILPMQIINSRRLSPVENRWLKDLNNNLALEAALDFISIINALGKTARIEAYLDVIIRANRDVMEEALHMGEDANSRLIKTLREIGVLDKLEANWEAKLETKVEEQAKTIAKNLANRGYPLEDIVATTGLDSATVKKLASE